MDIRIARASKPLIKFLRNPKQSTFLVLLLSLIYIFFLLYPAPEPNVSGETTGRLYYVNEIVDGDTVRVVSDLNEETIRLIGVDTPESVKPNTPVQCFAKEATAKTTELLLFRNVFLESDPTQANVDRYGRLLRYIKLEDGTNINLELIRQGYAFEYTYQNQPYIYQNEFSKAESQARTRLLGLWSPDTCNGKVD